MQKTSNKQTLMCCFANSLLYGRKKNIPPIGEICLLFHSMNCTCSPPWGLPSQSARRTATPTRLADHHHTPPLGLPPWPTMRIAITSRHTSLAWQERVKGLLHLTPEDKDWLFSRARFLITYFGGQQDILGLTRKRNFNPTLAFIGWWRPDSLWMQIT